MTNIAILGFGVVGSGVADLITNNYAEVKKFGGDDINIKYILDLRDFPDSPFSDRIVHDFNVILDDESVSVVIEVMGGSHPAYEFTVSSLKAGKSVITSNKEVVANFGDEFLKLANENRVSYRFEASVGGGIPVISPMISCISQNKIKEVRGILNGTTNYILTKMFTFGDSFEAALKDAQDKGYAERNPDADVLGIDAARKIVILSALATGSLVSVDGVYAEGITAIRKSDVLCAEKLGCSIKLLGRCVCTEDKPYIFVSPFMLRSDSALSGVCGVYNAVEVVGEPLGNVMFYGKGAGAGATASAVVGDLMQIMRYGAIANPVFTKSESVKDFSEFECERYFAFDIGAEDKISEIFGKVNFIESEECAFIAPKMSETCAKSRVEALSAIGVKLLSTIRIL
ncbi:MAG: homoserine dehydrogenase [Ruminococcaceae bacterium]|nr:homoserine dehydrogenase [Oscillospiraceae bacterium]